MASSHLDMCHLLWASGLVDIRPRRSRCTLRFTHSCVQRCSQQHLLCWPHTQDMKPFFLLPWQYHSVSWSEASLGAKIHLCGWIQSWIRPQINSCIIMIKSCTVYRLLFIISFIQRPVYTTKVQETADTLKDASTILQIKHECYIYASCLFHLRLLWCLWLVSLAPLASLSCTAPQQRRPCWVM